MIPGSLAALILFVVGLGPGYVFLRTSETRRPRPERSDLLETVEVLGVGLLSTAVGVLLVLLLGTAFPATFIDGNDWLAGGTDYLRDNVQRPIRSSLLALGLSALLAWGFPRFLYRKTGKRLEIGISAWQRHMDGNHAVAKWAQILMRDGRILEGVVDSFTYDITTPRDERELSLVAPLYVTPPGGARLPYNAGHVLIIPAREMVQLAVSDVTPSLVSKHDGEPYGASAHT